MRRWCDVRLGYLVVPVPRLTGIITARACCRARQDIADLDPSFQHWNATVTEEGRLIPTSNASEPNGSSGLCDSAPRTTRCRPDRVEGGDLVVHTPITGEEIGASLAQPPPRQTQRSDGLQTPFRDGATYRDRTGELCGSSVKSSVARKTRSALS